MATEPTGFSDFVTADILGEGGMGRVYKARQLSLDRWVALKVLPAAKDKKFADRFIREARSAARLVHPNIVQIYTVGEAKGIPFYSMEYIEGEDLENILRVSSDPLTHDETVEVIRCVTKALSLAMEHAIVHRDIKPANIMITRSGLVKVMDFGLAKGLGAADQGLTQAGLVVGTPTYMSPEQGASRAVDSRSDLYSVGCVLYYCLTGQPPFVADNVASLLYKHMFEAPERPSALAQGIHPGLEAVCVKMLEKKPEDRFQSPMEVLEALAQLPGNPTLAELALSKRATKAWQARKGAGTRLKTEVTPAAGQPAAVPFSPIASPRQEAARKPVLAPAPDTDIVPQQVLNRLVSRQGDQDSAPTAPPASPPRELEALETSGPPPRPSPDSSAAQTVVRMEAVDFPGESGTEVAPDADARPESPPAPPPQPEAINEDRPLTPVPNPLFAPLPGRTPSGSASAPAVPPPPLAQVPPPPPPPPPPSGSAPRMPSAVSSSPGDTESGIRKPLARVDDNFVRLPDGRWSYRVEAGNCKFAEGLANNLNPVPPLDAEKLGDCLLCSNWNKRTGCTIASCQELEAVRRYKGLKLATEQSILWVGALRFDRAIAVWEAYMKANPDDPEGFRELARVYDWPEYQGKDKRRAVVLYRRFAEMARGNNKFSQVEIARADERASSMMGTGVETKSSLITPSIGVAFHAFYRGAIVCFGYGVLTPERLIFARAGDIDPDSGILAADMGGAYGRATTIFRRFKSENAKRDEQAAVRRELIRLSSLALEELATDPARILVLPCEQMTGVDVTTDTAVNIRVVKIRGTPNHDLLFTESTYFKADQCFELLRRRLAAKQV